MHITKNSLFRKLSIISLAVLIFVSSLLGASVNTANAVGVDTVVKLVGGKAVLRSLAEKAGMALSPKQLDNMASVIEKKSFDGDQKAIDFINKANNVIDMPSTEPASKSGFKKYILEPAMWLTGLDIIFDVVEAFQSGYDQTTNIEMFAQCAEKPLGMSESLPYWYKVMYNSDASMIYYVAYSNESGSYTVSGTTIEFKDLGSWTLYKDQGSSVSYANSGSEVFSWTGSVLGANTDEQVCSKPVEESDVINISNVDNSTKQSFDNDTYNTNTVYNMEIEMPDNVENNYNYDNDTSIWNETDPNIGQEVDPQADSDNDGIPDDKDSNADGDGFLENLLGIVALIAIFDLLKAVIFYLARMFEFILTIPLIDSIPIDNVAFEWFRTAEIVGIEIYSVVSLLATVGLSFAVYKVVRRLLP